MLDALLVLKERQYEDGGGDEADDDPGVVPSERHTSVDRDQQGSDADREQEAADHVEGVVLAAVGCGEDEPCECNGDRHAGTLDHEQHPPTGRLDQWAADGHPDCWRSGEHGAPRAGDSRAAVLGEHRHHDGERRRPGRRGEALRNDPDGDQHERGGGERCQERKHGSARKPDEVHAAVPVEVAELARHRRKDSEGEQGAGDDPGDNRNTRVEIGGDRGQGGGQDGDRERRAGHPGERHYLHGPRAEPTVVGWGEKAHRSTLGERSFTFLAV